MSWVTQLAQTYGNMTDWVEDTVNGIHKVLIDAGWTLLDEISATSGQTDRVYYSTGEDGTEKLYFRMIQVTGTQKLRFRLYTLWDPSGHAGYNEVKNDADNPMTISVVDQAFTGWIVANKNGLTLVYRQVGDYNGCYVGIPTSRIVPTNKSGRTTISAGATITASGETVLSVTSSSNIKVGQKVRVLNQTVGANGGNFVRCTVTAVATGQITVTNDSAVATTFDSGALVGFDPQPIMFQGNSYGRNGGAGSYIGSYPASAFFIYGMDTLRMTGSAIALASFKQYATNTMHAFLNASNPAGGYPTGVLNSDMYWRSDPDVNGNYGVLPMLFVGGRSNNADSADDGIRAQTDRVVYVTRGAALANEDRLEVDDETWVCAFGYTDYGSGNQQYSTAYKIAE
jgi:hypothetical protein